MKQHPLSCRSGMTLLELVVAITILSLLSIAGHRLLIGITHTHDRASHRLQQLEQLQTAFQILNHDLRHMVHRPVKGSQGQLLPFLFYTDMKTLEFTHAGWPVIYSAERRSDVQRVEYRLEEGKLIKRFWRAPDGKHSASQREMILLTGVAEFSIQFLTNQKPRQWMPALPLEAENSLPAAVKISLHLSPFGPVERVVELMDKP